MPKQKTKSAAKKRFKILASGKVKRACVGKAHLAKDKRRKNIRNLNKGAYVSDTLSKSVKQLVGKGGISHEN